MPGNTIPAGGLDLEDPTSTLFHRALGLVPPWSVAKIAFDAELHRLDIHVSFERGARFPCPEGDRDDCAVHDITEKEWRHLNFFEHEAYLHAGVPRVRCPQHGVRLIQVAWARPGSGFTLLFEALAMLLMREMPVKAAARIVGEHDTRLWRVLMHHVDAARSQEDFSGVRQVGVDETSHRQGQDYVSVFVDLNRAKVIFATPTHEKKVIGEFKTDLEAHGGKAADVFGFSTDLWKPYRIGIQEQFPNATLTLDRYHVVQLLNRAVDDVRRQEQRTAPGLKRSRYSWLKKPSKLTPREKENLFYLQGRYRQTGRAYELKLLFDDMWSLSADMAPGYLVAWCSEVQRSGLEPLKAFAETIDEHRYLVLRWFRTHISIGVLEAINGVVQAAKRRARGYRTDRHYIAMIYMTAGKLNFGLPI